MDDSARIAHAGPGHDETGTGLVVDGFGFIGGRRRLHRVQVGLQGILAEILDHLVVEKLLVTAVDARGLDGHRAVEKDGEGLHLARAEHLAQQEREQLRAADGEGRHEHLAVVLHGILHDGLKLLYRVKKRLVITIAVGGFEEDQISAAERLVVLENGRAARAEVAGEHDALLPAILIDDQLDAARAEHVSGLGPDGLHAGRNGHWLLVRHGLELLE